jgi:hypothetical protein
MTAHASELRLRGYTVLNALQMKLVECQADADVRSIARAMADNAIHCVVVRGIERQTGTAIASAGASSATST